VIEAIVIVIWLGFAIVVGVVAKTRGRSWPGWSVLAVAISPPIAGWLLLTLQPATAQPLVPPPRARGAVAEGDGDYRFQVVGEASYQHEIEAIVGGRTEESADHECVAVLVPEPDNPHDPNAVYVLIERRKVGYLPRDQAAVFKKALDRHGYEMCACWACIVGGWDRGGDDRGHYGVRLDVALPLDIRPAPLSSPPNVLSKEIVGQAPIRLRLAVGGALAVAALFALWGAATWWVTAPPELSSMSAAAPRTDALVTRVDSAGSISTLADPTGSVPSPTPVDVPLPRPRPRQNF
jgi:hypothetical protein